MAVLRSFTTALHSIGRRPTLAAPAAGLALISVGSVVGQGSLLSLLTSVLALFVGPFLTAGFIALAEDARTGNRRETDFVAAGKRYTLRLLGGNLLIGIALVAVSAVLLFGAFVVVGGFDALRTGNFAVTPVNVALLGALALVGWLVSLLFQFFSPAAVVEDRRVGNAIGRSVEVVTDNFLAVVGFALLSGLVSTLLNLVPMWYFVFGAATTPEAVFTAVQAGYPGAATPLALTALFATSLVSTLLLQTYLVCFFGACTETTRRADDAVTIPS